MYYSTNCNGDIICHSGTKNMKWGYSYGLLQDSSKVAKKPFHNLNNKITTIKKNVKAIGGAIKEYNNIHKKIKKLKKSAEFENNRNNFMYRNNKKLINEKINNAIQSRKDEKEYYLSKYGLTPNYKKKANEINNKYQKKITSLKNESFKNTNKYLNNKKKYKKRKKYLDAKYKNTSSFNNILNKKMKEVKYEINNIK